MKHELRCCRKCRQGAVNGRHRNQPNNRIVTVTPTLAGMILSGFASLRSELRALCAEVNVKFSEADSRLMALEQGQARLRLALERR